MIKDKEKLQAYLDDIEQLNKKHNLRLIPVITSNKHSINAQFDVEEVETEPKANGSTDSGNQASKS